MTQCLSKYLKNSFEYLAYSNKLQEVTTFYFVEVATKHTK